MRDNKAWIGKDSLRTQVVRRNRNVKRIMYALFFMQKDT